MVDRPLGEISAGRKTGMTGPNDDGGELFDDSSPLEALRPRPLSCRWGSGIPSTARGARDAGFCTPHTSPFGGPKGSDTH